MPGEYQKARLPVTVRSLEAGKSVIILAMQIKDIIFLPDIVDKLEWKHNVNPDEVMDILFGQPLYRKVQKGHIPGEDVYAGLGQTRAGRYVVVFFVYKKTREALVLSAREMDRKERKQYERK